MCEKTDEEKPNAVSAQKLYLRYQKKRLSSEQSQSYETATHSSMQNNDSGFAQALYKRYQSKQIVQGAITSEAVLQTMDKQDIERLLQLDEQPLASTDIPVVQGIRERQGQIDFNIQANSPAANKHSTFKRFVLPAVAVAMLAVVITPLIKNTPTVVQPVILPVSLAEQATRAVEFIDMPSSGAFGFSDTADSSKTSFNRGVSLVDSFLLIEAGRAAEIAPYIKSMMSPASVQSANVLLGKTISEGGNVPVLKAKLEVLAKEVEKVSRQSGHLDWYRMGHSIESIIIAAEYALVFSDTSILKHALAFAAEHDLPDNNSHIAMLIDELFRIELSAAEEFVQVSKILTVANDIKMFMQ